MNTDASSPHCPLCGAVIPREAPQNLCPRCVLQGAASSTDSGGATRHRDPPSLDAVRAAFPQLEVLDLIGQGGMGFVYSARQPHLDRKVALKLLPVTAGSDPAFGERFAREGRLLARLNHPHIVAVYEFGQTAGFAFLLMELVDGVNLRQAMRSGRFSPSEALSIVPAICEALQYAHDQGVLHRDIKPENILLDARGRVKIADFGIAKLVGDPRSDITLTGSGAQLGTPHYMAPEQIESPSAVDHRADIYSLGVVFYELLTGELPLGRFAPPSSKAALDARIDEIVLRALAKERELRQQSAGEMKTQVEGLGTSEIPRTAAPALLIGRPQNFEYKSPRTLAGLPLVHVVAGHDPVTGLPREAHGILAVGPRARGWFALGGIARGFVAMGGGAFGVFAFGGFAAGGFAVGGMALGLVSFGGCAIALFLALGGLAIGWEALGGLAVGHQALGGLAYSSTPAVQLRGWRSTLLGLLPWMWVPALLLNFVVVGVTLWAVRLQRRMTDAQPSTAMSLNPWPKRIFAGILIVIVVPAILLVIGLVAPQVSLRANRMTGTVVSPRVSGPSYESGLVLALVPDETTQVTVTYWSNGVAHPVPGASLSLRSGVLAPLHSETPLRWQLNAIGSGEWSLTHSGELPGVVLAFPTNFVPQPLGGHLVLKRGERRRRWIFVPAGSGQTPVTSEQWDSLAEPATEASSPGAFPGTATNRPAWGISLDFGPQEVGVTAEGPGRADPDPGNSDESAP